MTRFLSSVPELMDSGLRGSRLPRGRALVLNAGAPGERPLPPKLAGMRLAQGDAVTIVTPGAGGYGKPGDGDGRAPAAPSPRSSARR